MGAVKLVIDGREITSNDGLSILEAAEQAGISIPTLCYRKELSAAGACRICVVEVEGRDTLAGSCHTPIEAGMVVHTCSPKVIGARKAIIEMLLAGHTGPCVKDNSAEQCELHKIASDLEVGPPTFSLRKQRFYPVEDVSPYVRRDLSKCILCGRCIRACNEIAEKHIYSMAYRGFRSKVVVDADVPLNKELCRDCSLCIEYCPTGALTSPGSPKKEKQGQGEKGKRPVSLSPKAPEREALLGMLKRAQKERGYISEASMAEIARILGLTISEVYGTATFYSFLSVKPKGRNLIRLCKSLSCFMKDAEMMIGSLEREIGIKPGETSRDERFSFELVNCIGACDEAPAMLINDDLHGHLTPEKISRILKFYP